MQAKYLIPILLLFTFFACTPKKSEILQSQSSDKEMKLQVWGEQAFPFEPWTVYVATDYHTEKDTVSTELHANTIDINSVVFEWQSNRFCIVNLKHQDGEIIQVPIRYRE